MGLNHKQLGRALLDAVITRDHNLARTLLDQGADPRTTDSEHDEGPIVLAAKFADAAMIRMLLDAGAEVDARDDEGRTALFFAPVSLDLFRVLLEAGADLNAKAHSGETILMRKVSECASLAEVEQLLELGVDASARNDEGDSAFDIARGLGLVLVVERLRSPAS